MASLNDARVDSRVAAPDLADLFLGPLQPPLRHGEPAPQSRPVARWVLDATTGRPVCCWHMALTERSDPPR
jgi:hypothetical protein